MPRSSVRTDVLLWSIIAAYTGVIYATLSVVSQMRKWLAETFGNGVWDYVYVVFVLVAVGMVVRIVRTHRRRGSLLRALTMLSLVALVYSYYLGSMKYAVERVHFLEYGLLGALVYGAVCRHWARGPAAAFSCALVYWIGLGDEAIQWALPNRVGEIGDSVINFFSGALGIAALHACAAPNAVHRQPTRHEIRVLFASLAATALLTGVFLSCVHGFGHVIETKEPGRMFSSFTAAQLAQINAGDGEVPLKDRRIYDDEALRHLHQREFYFTNDFAIKGGGHYRSYDRAQLENALLETYYARYLREQGTVPAGELLAEKDPEVAEKSMGRTAMWADSLRLWLREQVGRRNDLLQSRVKSTVIVDFAAADLWFYVVLALMISAYGWYAWRPVNLPGGQPRESPPLA